MQLVRLIRGGHINISFQGDPFLPTLLLGPLVEPSRQGRDVQRRWSGDWFTLYLRWCGLVDGIETDEGVLESVSTILTYSDETTSRWLATLCIHLYSLRLIAWINSVKISPPSLMKVNSGRMFKSGIRNDMIPFCLQQLITSFAPLAFRAIQPEQEDPHWEKYMWWFCGDFHHKSRSPQVLVVILFTVGSKVRERSTSGTNMFDSMCT